MTNKTDYRQTEINIATLAQDMMTPITIDGRSIILTLWEGKPAAFSGRCPHAAADLTEGDLYRGRIDCPMHGWRFDIITGRTLYPADEGCRLKRYACRVDDTGSVYIQI